MYHVLQGSCSAHFRPGGLRGDARFKKQGGLGGQAFNVQRSQRSLQLPSPLYKNVTYGNTVSILRESWLGRGMEMVLKYQIISSIHVQFSVDEAMQHASRVGGLSEINSYAHKRLARLVFFKAKMICRLLRKLAFRRLHHLVLNPHKLFAQSSIPEVESHL